MVEPTPLKNMLVKLDHFPNFRGENKKSLKTPPRKPFVTFTIYKNNQSRFGALLTLTQFSLRLGVTGPPQIKGLSGNLPYHEVEDYLNEEEVI